MKFVLVFLMFVCSLVCQGLPAPVFPPITTAYLQFPNCGGLQPNSTTTDAQKSRLFTNTNPNPFLYASGMWVTHETWCESLPGGGYIPILAIQAGSNSTFPCGGITSPAVNVPGAASGFDLLWLNNYITVTATHQYNGAFNTFYYWGWQIPTSAIGYFITTQWVRLDPNNGLLYLGDLKGYSVSL